MLRITALGAAGPGRIGLLMVGLAAVAMAWFPTDAGASDRIELPPGPNRDLVYARCRVCHDLQYVVESAGITRDNWQALLEDMKGYGLRIPQSDHDKILEYLGTYMGPNPPKAAPEGAPKPVSTVDGRAVFEQNCSSCHQGEGQGLHDTFPPLAGNPDLFIDRMFPVYVVLNGLQGPLTVKGGHYQGVMPPFDHLPDAEIAAVITYVRAAWGNDGLRPAGFSDIDEAAVKDARSKPMEPRAVHAYREAHK
ncbi:MAG: cytochrome c [Arenicellales bacterium]